MLKKNIHYRLYIPKSIDLSIIAKTYPQFKGFKEDKAYYFLYLINKPHLTASDNRDWTFISSQGMRNTGVRDFKAYRKYLEKAGVIITYGGYSKDLGYSRKFKIAPKYHDIDKTILISSKAFAKKVNKMFSIDMKDIKNNINLYKSFNDNLTIDFESAINEIDREFISTVDSWNQMTPEEQKLVKDPYKRHKQNQYSIYSIHDKKFRFKQDESSGRLHTVITNMSKDVKKHLRYNGKKLINLDFKNSQPFLSSLLFNENFWNENLSKGFKVLGKNKLAKFSDCQCYITKDNDIDKYVEEVRTGTFYEEFMRLTNSEDRGETKRQALIVMYSANSVKTKNKTIFKKNYPNVSKMFECLKKDNYKQFPILLQQIEASLFIGRIAKRIALERPLMSLFTIHDSILCLEEDSSYIRDIMIEETIKLVGVKPNISNE